jgi:hypothetical protein
MPSPILGFYNMENTHEESKGPGSIPNQGWCGLWFHAHYDTKTGLPSSLNILVINFC